MEPSHEPSPPKRSSAGVGAAMGAGVLAVLAKSKGLLVFLPKLLLTFGSMAVMIWAEATRAGWLFAVGFVLCIFVHEMGHAMAIRRHGLASSWPVFIPFFGALITLQGTMSSPVVEAEIGIAGPMWGAAASTISVVLFWFTHDKVWLAVAMTGYLINLFNLTPMRPLDGGRVAQLFSRRAWILGAVLLVGLFVTTWSPLLLLLALTGIPRAFSASAEAPDLESTPAEIRLQMAIEYFGLAIFLALGFYFTHRMINPTGS